MAEKTIKELADEIGVSKTAIHKKVTPDMRNKFFSKIGNKFVISEEGQEAIKSTFIVSFSETENQKPETDNSTTKETKSENTITSEVSENNLSDAAIKIIENYQKQLEQKDKQLSELHKLLDQQQQLTLHSNKQNELLQLQIEANENEKKEQPVPNQQYIKKKWWQIWN